MSDTEMFISSVNEALQNGQFSIIGDLKFTLSRVTDRLFVAIGENGRILGDKLIKVLGVKDTDLDLISLPCMVVINGHHYIGVPYDSHSSTGIMRKCRFFEIIDPKTLFGNKPKYTGDIIRIEKGVVNMNILNNPVEPT
jgi:hypothetical protein